MAIDFKAIGQSSTFQGLVTLGKDAARAAYEAKIKTPALAQVITPATSAQQVVPAAAEKKPTMVERIKGGDPVMIGVILAAVVGAGALYYKMRR